MKKLIFVLAVLTMLFFVVGCGGSNSTATLSPTNQPQPVSAITPTPEPTATPTPTPEPTATPTPTPIQYAIEVSVFHDLNGNETQDSGEPPILGAIVKAAELSCTTDTDGRCEIGHFPPGEYRVKIDTSSAQLEGFDYLFANRDVFNPKVGLLVNVSESLLVTIALAQGPFPIPIAEESFAGISYGFGDLHDLYGNGNLAPHQGLDIDIRGDGPQPIYAQITGQAKPGPDGTWGECNLVTIWFTKFGLDVAVGMGHLTEVVIKPNDFVKKGDLIGYIDPSLYYPGFVSCTSHPHIHVGIWGSIPGETWPRAESGLPWQVLPAGEWGWLNPEKYLPMVGIPLPMFDSIDEAEVYAQN